jgi:hypothetical protein
MFQSKTSSSKTVIARLLQTMSGKKFAISNDCQDIGYLAGIQAKRVDQNGKGMRNPLL